MSYHIDIQHACNDALPVTDETLNHWVTSTLRLHFESAEITLRLVNAEEITELNHTYRKKNKATNVLAFPAAHPEHVELEFPFLGDIIVCPTVLKQESENLGISLIAHWAHITIHGVLHLLGYDHIKDDDAIKMQAVETELLAELGFDNPYETEAN